MDIPGDADHTFRGQTVHLFRGNPIKHSEAWRLPGPSICENLTDNLPAKNVETFDHMRPAPTAKPLIVTISMNA